MKIISRLIILLIAVSATSSNAALYYRGNGMIYDSMQNITWLQDSNYGVTTGAYLFNHPQGVSWAHASGWASALTYGGFDDWRLPSARLIGTGNIFSYDGSTDYGYNNTRSELGHLFAELGNLAYCNTAGSCDQPGYGWLNSTFIDAATNQSVSFLNVQWGYWEAELAADGIGEWLFSTNAGFQGPYYGASFFNAWAVRDGDVLPVNEVPIPSAVWLMSTALIGLTGIARRKK